MAMLLSERRQIKNEMIFRCANEVEVVEAIEEITLTEDAYSVSVTVEHPVHAGVLFIFSF